MKKIKLPNGVYTALSWYNKTVAPIIATVLVIWASVGDQLTPLLPASVIAVLIPILNLLQHISKANVQADESLESGESEVE
jgi:hypothetical protein